MKIIIIKKNTILINTWIMILLVYSKRKDVEQLVQPDIAIVMKIAVASLGNFHANVRNAG